MAVYKKCTHCGTRWEHCADQTAHRRSLAWVANVKFTRNSPRLQKSFRVDQCEKPRELAEIQERQWRTDYERGQLIPKQHVEVHRFDEVADEWLTMATAQRIIKASNVSEKYRVGNFKRRFGSKNIGDLKFADGEAWINDRVRAGIAVGTINREMKPLNWIMNYAVKKGYCTSNPFLEIKQLKGANIHDRWMTQNELNSLIQAARRLEDYDLVDFIAVAVNTGFRLGNLARLTARDISSNRAEAEFTKSGKPYAVPIAPAVVPTLKRLIEAHPTGPLLNTKKIGERFRAASRAAGLYTDKKDLQRVTIHTLRHTFAVLYLKRGGDLYPLSKLMGHASTGVTDKTYARLCPQERDAQAPLMSTPIIEEDRPEKSECPQAESNRSSQIENLMS